MQPEILLGLVALILFPSGQALPDKEISVPPNSSIVVLTDINDPVIKVIWKRINNGKELKIIKIQNGNVTPILDDRYNPDINGRNLVINNPTENDSGAYRVEVTLNDTIITQTINVTLSDPVPPVQITPEVKRIGDRCNITLTCSAPSNTSDLSYTWMYRRWDSQYQSTATTGNIMQTVLPLDHQEMEYMCMVENLADQKNISVHIETCSVKLKNDQSADNKRNLIIVLSVVAVLMVVVGALMAVLGWKCWKRSSETSEDTSYSGVASSDGLERRRPSPRTSNSSL